MGSVTNSLTSAANTAVTSTPSGSNNPSGVFTGTSSYSTDLQNIISRSVAIASMPITLLNSQQAALNNQSTELATLDSKFAALQMAVQGISTAMGGASFQSTSSAPLAVTATLGAGAAEGIYNVKVDNVGATATSLSTASWNQPALAAGQTATYGLLIGTQEYKVTTSDNSVQGVAAAIQAQYGSQVNAIAVNVGANSWRISLQSTTLGPVSLNLIQVPSSPTVNSLQTQNPTGYAVSQTTSTWADSAGSYNLLVNGVPYALITTVGTAADVAGAINTAATANGLAVNAVVVDLGTGGTHDYRIQLESTTAGGAIPLDIQNGAGPGLQTQQTMATSGSTATWIQTADAPNTRSQYTLTVGANTYNFAADDNTAQKVAGAINSQFGSMVNATVVDLTGSGDFRIRLQDKTGNNPTLNIQQTVANSFQTQQTIGQLAQYEIDGAAPATSNSPSINVANGVTLNLLGLNADLGGIPQPVSVVVTQSVSALSTALTTFTTAYNAAADELAKQRGQTAGPLQGQSILSTLTQTLRSMSTYSLAGAPDLKSMGLELGLDGHLTLDPIKLLQVNFANAAGVSAYYGSATGTGFLRNATDALANLKDPLNGLLTTSESALKSQISDIGTHIATKQAQVDLLQKQLTSQMAAADALIASMQQQYSYMSSMFAAQQTASQSYK
jgi:flagellar hook-associated protein 2